MSAATQGTRIFGIRIGLDPKILIGILIALAATLFWYNSRGDDVPVAPAMARPESTPAPALAARPRPVARGSVATNGRGTLRVRPIDATRGDVDPTLRLDLLARLHLVQPATNGRSLFESGSVAQAASLPKIKGPTVVPKPLPVVPSTSSTTAAAALNIPLKYYGFVKPTATGESNRGFFLDGDNVLVASEGELLKQRYLVVTLAPNSVRLEDVQLKQGQTLQVVPEATP